MAAHIYKTSDGKRVPSVTTINKIGQESGGLIHWAWELGINGLDYRQVREDAAEKGKVGHKLVDAAIKGHFEADLSMYDDEIQTSGQRAFSAYLDWREQTRIEILHSELSLVSEEHRFGGTLDAIGFDTRKRTCILDWKSGGLYHDHLCQVAAYGYLWDQGMHRARYYVGECQKLDEKWAPISGGYHLCRFNRDTGDFAHAYFADLSDAWQAFLLKRELYTLLQKLKKRV